MFRHNLNLRAQAVGSHPFTEPSPPDGNGAWLVSPPIKIKNRLGLHARAAARVVKTLEPFGAEVFLVRDDSEVDAKSVLSLLTLDCPYDAQVRIKARGEGATEALTLLADAINNRFGEE